VSVAYTVAAVIALSVVAGKDEGLGGSDLMTPVTRVLVATAVMAAVTVLAVNVSGATSGFALLGRVFLAVVAGTVAFAGTTVVLAAREERRPGHRGATRPPEAPEPIAPPPLPSPDGPLPAGSGPDGPRERAAQSSIRLITPDTPAGGTESGAPAGQGTGDAPDPRFRGRLGAESDGAPVRHLRPVPGGHGGGRTTGTTPAQEAEGLVPPNDEEEPHGPDPGGNR
jgi:hypothetical protein